MAILDMTGRRFARLTVLRRAENDKYGNAFWLCQCECGNKVRISGYSLRSGHTKSCGCIQKEVASKIASRGSWFYKNNLPHVHEIHTIYFGMKERCLNRNNMEYSHYGGKGISICKEWLDSPEKFYWWAINNGYSKGLTIERMDNNKGYNPDNCRFATRAEQNRNTSRNNRVIDEATGKTLVTAEVARLIGVSRSTAAKWYRNEGLRTLREFKDRVDEICLCNRYRGARA